MDQLITVLKNLVTFLQKPAWGFLAVTILVGGYHFYTGQEGTQKGKKWISAGVIAVIVIKLAQVLTDSMGAEIGLG
jgi:hypothetical protein